MMYPWRSSQGGRRGAGVSSEPASSSRTSWRYWPLSGYIWSRARGLPCLEEVPVGRWVRESRSYNGGGHTIRDFDSHKNRVMVSSSDALCGSALGWRSRRLAGLPRLCNPGPPRSRSSHPAPAPPRSRSLEAAKLQFCEPRLSKIESPLLGTVA
jgi:hypothetical protein